jgi:hypothetical protein
LTIPNPFGLSDHWWAYCENLGGGSSCTPTGDGDWAATLVAAPEPMTLGVFAAALVGLGLTRRTQAAR